MPKVNVSVKDRMNNSAREMIDVWLARACIPRTEAHKKLFLSYPTFHRRYNSPDTMTVSELRMLVKVAKPTDEEILRIIKERI